METQIQDTTANETELRKILIRRIIKKLSKEQIEYILTGYLDDETTEDLKERLK